MQGYDLTPILTDPSAKVRDHCIIEEDEDVYKATKQEKYKDIRIRTMITEDYRTTIYQGYGNTGDLFDLKKILMSNITYGIMSTIKKFEMD